MHAPYTINEDIKEVGNTSSLQEAYASLKIVNEFISNMKEQGIYERANIVILADHGHNHLRQHALLLIKDLIIFTHLIFHNLRYHLMI